MAACYLSPQCRIEFKCSPSPRYPCYCSVNKQQQPHQLREMDSNSTSSPKASKVSRRLAMELVGFNSVLLLHVCPCPAHAAPLMGYSGATGPDKWGSLSPYYSACSCGKSQSPIDVKEKNTVVDQNLGPLTIRYNDTSATLVNQGFNVELQFGNNAGGAIIGGTNYTLKRMHWHSPSEHTIDGVRYAAELHLVHTSLNGSTSVVAILYKYGAPDPVFSQIRDQFYQLAKEASAGYEGAHIPVKFMRVSDIVQTTKRYFSYEGSLTTPPCSEKVIWNILMEVREISKEQVAALKAPLDESCKNNSRPTQPLNDRIINIFSPLI